MKHLTLPKPLVPVAGKPMLDRVLDGLVSAGHTQVVLVVGYLANLIQTQYGAQYNGMKIDYAFQPQQEGTAHAVYCGAGLLRDEQEVLVAWSDILVRPTWYHELWRQWDLRPGLAALHTVVKADPSKGSLVHFDDQLNMTAISSRPYGITCGWRDGGISIQARESITTMGRVAASQMGERRFSTAIQMLLKEGRRIGVALYQGPWCDLANSAAIEHAELEFAGLFGNTAE